MAKKGGNEENCFKKCGKLTNCARANCSSLGWRSMSNAKFIIVCSRLSWCNKRITSSFNAATDRILRSLSLISVSKDLSYKIRPINRSVEILMFLFSNHNSPQNLIYLHLFHWICSDAFWNIPKKTEKTQDSLIIMNFSIVLIGESCKLNCKKEEWKIREKFFWHMKKWVFFR